jgi:hypothetical protein
VSEPILKPGETPDYFDIWHALIDKSATMPEYVNCWAARSESRAAYLVAVRDAASLEIGCMNASPMDLVEMISRMIVDINDIVYRERTERFVAEDVLSGGNE